MFWFLESHFRLQNSYYIDDNKRTETETERTDRTLYKTQFDLNTLCEEYNDTLKSDSHLPQKNVLFALLKAR